jgi:hypothetical protein
MAVQAHLFDLAWEARSIFSRVIRHNVVELVVEMLAGAALESLLSRYGGVEACPEGVNIQM